MACLTFEQYCLWNRTSGQALCPMEVSVTVGWRQVMLIVYSYKLTGEAASAVHNKHTVGWRRGVVVSGVRQ